MGPIQGGRAPFPLTGIVHADVHERLKIGGFRTFVRSDVSGIRFIVSSIGVKQDLVGPVRSRAVFTFRTSRVGIVDFAVEMIGAT
ncbi:hypothetical protein ACPW96_14985 [Micromonospora sp. DT81.3]|uniref:hypothetical protein n=1 Tax=Micromonospora sp. DT81.3 TaxID=3416523 RepID=UPI003CF6333F